MKSCHIALGANKNSTLGGPAQTLVAAIAALSPKNLHVQRVSRFFSSPCFPVGAGPDYVNAVIECRCDLSPSEVLARLHEVEADFGRERVQRWGMRVLDLDLVAYGDTVLPTREEQARWRHLPLEQQMRDAPAQLILPHPRIQDRAFVLVPLSDIAPGWRHPATGQGLDAMMDALPQGDRAALIPL